MNLNSVFRSLRYRPFNTLIRPFSTVTMAPPRKRSRTDEGRVSPPLAKRMPKQVSTTTQQAVSNFFTPASQKEKVSEKLSWRTVNSSLIVGRYSTSSSGIPELVEEKKPRKVAAFDFDSTIIRTVSKAQFAKDANDWCWWHGSVPGKLKELDDEGYILVILSNQNGISLRNIAGGPKITKNDRFTQFKQKSVAVFNALNLPINIYAATERDKYRKPGTGMWEQFLIDQNLTAEDIDFEASIFVGDAGGRLAGVENGKIIKADFSCSDRNMADNVGLRYQTPEEYFLAQPPRNFVRSFDPSTLLAGDTEAIAPSKSNPLDIFLFVGSPGAGKSTFYRKFLEPLGYERINQDTLKTREKCLKVASEYLQQGKSVAIDNTNPDRETRKHWIDLAKKFNVPIRCALFTASTELARHNDTVRALAGLIELNPESRQILPQLAFTSFSSRYKEPVVNEGFQDIVQVDFKFEGAERERKIWGKYWY